MALSADLINPALNLEGKESDVTFPDQLALGCSFINVCVGSVVMSPPPQKCDEALLNFQ